MKIKHGEIKLVNKIDPLKTHKYFGKKYLFCTLVLREPLIASVQLTASILTRTKKSQSGSSHYSLRRAS